MFTVAGLAIHSFTTDLILTGDNWRPGQPRKRLNVIPPGQPGTMHTTADFQAEADRLLAEHGYSRTGGWIYHSGMNAYVTAITQNLPVEAGSPS